MMMMVGMTLVLVVVVVVMMIVGVLRKWVIVSGAVKEGESAASLQSLDSLGDGNIGVVHRLVKVSARCSYSAQKL